MLFSQLSSTNVIRLGLLAIALRGIVMMAFRHQPQHEDLVDFLQGALIGIGGTLLMIGVWRRAREGGSRCA